MNYPRLLKNMALSTLALAVSMAVSFFLYPFLIRHLGEARYGVWALLGSITGYLGLLDFGFGLAVTKYVAEYEGGGDRDRVRAVLRGGARLYFYSSLGVAAAAAALYGGFPRLFPHLEAGLGGEARLVLLVVGADLVFSFWFLTVRAGLEGLQRFDVTSLLNALSTVLRAIALAALVEAGLGLVALALAALVINRAADLLAWWRLRRELGPGRGASGPEGAGLPGGQLFSYGIYVFIDQVAGRIFYYTDNLVIAVMIGPAAITHYAMAFLLVEVVRNFTHKAMSVMMPAVSELAAEGEAARPKLARLFESGSRLAGIFSLPPLLALMVTGKSFMAAWLGPGYDDAYWCLVVMAAPQLWILSQSLGLRIIYGMARHQRYAWYSLTVSLLNLGLSVALAGPLGILGVALGTSAPIFLGRVYMNDYFRRLLGMKMGPYYWRVWRRLLPAGILWSGALWGWFQVAPPRGLAMHLLVYAVFFVGFEAAGLAWMLGPEERAMMRSLWVSFRKGGGDA
jgi:O-antigen/teichoic acid export membrane protein